MSRSRSNIGLVLLLVISLLIFAGVATAANSYLNRTKPKQAQTTQCKTKGQQHTVTISDNKLNTPEVTGSLCDTLTIKNADDKLRLIGFGEHDHHTAYDGVYQRNLGGGESFTITFNKIGTYGFHDHFDESAEGSFTVTN